MNSPELLRRGYDVEGRPDLRLRLDQVLRIGIALSSERDTNKLLELILEAAKSICNADAGTIYKLRNNDTLDFAIVKNDTLGLSMGGSNAPKPFFPPLKLYDDVGKPILSMVATYAVHLDRAVLIDDAYEDRRFDFSGTRRFDSTTGYRSHSFLTVPMKNHENELIGVLQLINAKDPYSGSIVPFSSADKALTESLASQAAIALTNQLLIQHLENLFESFIRLINVAIDDKSPHTGRHCERVPSLTMMLADAVSECGVGPLRAFTMSERDRKELKIAGLLHDCGKITTPVHVVDKATKLQTIFDRIELVDTRFEVVRRDLQIAQLKGARSDVSERLAELEADREFLHRCNIGRERMEDHEVARIHEIAKKYRWQVAGDAPRPFLTDDEINNLSVRFGTLNPDERDTINRHIDLTIQMLETLPWPKHLQNVPEYAGGHHERMDGKGYPRGLTREQMSIQARCVGIADIFEALTAADRPYKKGKKLSESLAILGRMKQNGHIDPDLFDVFIWKKVYLRYAEQFLDPEQIDDVDLESLPGYAPPPSR